MNKTPEISFEKLYIQFAEAEAGNATIRKWSQFPFAGAPEYALTAALQSAAEAPPPQPNVEQWRPWIDMPVGDQRGVVREVRSENGETALAYWTGEIMALAPVSDNPVPLPFKVWGQRPVQQSNAADLERQAHPPAEHLTPEQSAAITDYRETMASLAWPQTSYQTVTAPVSPAPQDNVKGASADVFAERERQIAAEGFNPGHDDKYRHDELTRAAMCYLLGNPGSWPWAYHWWKPGDRRRNLVKSAALIIAEIERIDRAALAATATEGSAE